MPFPKYVLAATAALLLLGGCGGWMGRAPERGPIVAVLSGNVATDPYNKAAHEGLQRIEDKLGIPVQVLEPAADSEHPMRDALRAAATSDTTLLIASGDEPRKLLLEVAPDYPEQRFAVIGAQSVAANVAAYDLRTEQGAWLAGAAAGLLTRSNVVGYVAGPTGPQALAWQQAFAAGLSASNAQARLVTRGSNAAANEWAGAVRAAAENKADIIYVVGDGVPYSAYAAARERGVALIADRHERKGPLAPPLIATVITNPGEAIYQAGRDLYDAMWKGGTIRRLGVDTPNAVGLLFARSVPEATHEQLEIYRKQLAASAGKQAAQGADERNGSL